MCFKRSGNNDASNPIRCINIIVGQVFLWCAEIAMTDGIDQLKTRNRFRPIQ